MKTSSDELFLLIKSLTTQEKVYFKAFSAKKRASSQSSGYLKMFNVLDKMKVYNDDLLKSNLKRAGFTNNIKESKRRVTEVILKSLTDFHSAQNKDVELQQLINRVHVLLERKLLDMAHKLLLKAKKLARDYERYEYLLLLSTLEKKILNYKSNPAEFIDYIKTEIERKRKYISYLNNTAEYENLSLQIEPIVHLQSGKMLEEGANKLRQILLHPLMKKSNTAITYESLKYFHSIKFRCGMLLNKLDEGVLSGQKEWINYLEKDSSKLKNRGINYLGGLNDILITLSTLGNFREVDTYFKKCQQFIRLLLPAEKTEQLLQMVPIIYGNYISAQLKVPDPQKALKAWDELTKTSALKASLSITNTILYGNLVSTYFLLGQFRKALTVSNKIIGLKSDNRIDVQQYARLLNLLINYELNRNDALPYAARSAQHFLLKSNGRLTEFEKCIIDYFEHELSGRSNQKEEREVFSKWKNKLLLLPRKSVFYPETSQTIFDFISWIESKIENRPFAEIVKEKAKRATI